MATSTEAPGSRIRRKAKVNCLFNSLGVIQYANGEEYNGELDDDKKHGSGRAESEN